MNPEDTLSHELLIEEINKLANRCARYGRLIRWLSRSYGDNDPIFPYNDLYGHELAANIELADTWIEVVRGRSAGQPAEATPSKSSDLEATQHESGQP